MILSLILLSVALSAAAQITMKFGLSSSGVRAGLGSGSSLSAALAVATNPLVIIGLSLYAIGAILWLCVLARIDVSRAYPFMGLGFVLTAAFAALFLGEKVTAMRFSGTLLVVMGVVLVARS